MSSLHDIVRHISQRYTPLNDICMQDFAACATLHEGDKGQVLVAEGQYADQAFYIIRGAAKAYYLKDGKSVTDWFAFEGDFITPIVSYFTQVPSPHFISLLEPSAWLSIRRQDAERLCQAHHDFERLVRLSVTQTMLQLQHRIASMQFETAAQKLDNLLHIYPDIMNRLPLGDIASYLGITQETLSRIRRKRI